MTKKKSTRPNLPQETLARARAELQGETVLVPSSDKGATVAAAREGAKPLVQPRKTVRAGSMVTVEDLKAEYSYVIGDLRNMAILALGLVVFIVTMALIFV